MERNLYCFLWQSKVKIKVYFISTYEFRHRIQNFGVVSFRCWHLDRSAGAGHQSEFQRQTVIEEAETFWDYQEFS